MNAQKLEQVTSSILDKMRYTEHFTDKKAHKYALAALSGKPCPLCDDLGQAVITQASGASAWDVCPVCVSIEDARYN